MSTTKPIARVRTRSAGLEGVLGTQPQSTEKKFYQATMTPEKFASFITHPRQRDTERHAAMAKRRHLGGFNITQANVSAAAFDGKFYKLDGHTRSHLWEAGALQKPDRVTVTIYNCETHDELLQLYTTFDNKFAAENGSDILSGAMREAGITVVSPMFRDYKFLSALKYAYAHANAAGRLRNPGGPNSPDTLVRDVRFFAKEIVLLDSIDPTVRLFKAGVTAGAFLALKRRGEQVLPFFAALNNNGGTKTATECDGVQALHDLIMSTNQGGRRDATHMTSRTLSCVETWLRGRTYSLSRLGVAGVKQTDIVDYTKSMGTNRERNTGDGGTVLQPATRQRASIETILPASL